MVNDVKLIDHAIRLVDSNKDISIEKFKEEIIKDPNYSFSSIRIQTLWNIVTYVTSTYKDEVINKYINTNDR